MVVERAVGVPNDIVPGPDAFVQRYVMVFASVAVAVCVNCSFFVWFPPALTNGLVLSTVTVTPGPGDSTLPELSVARVWMVYLPSEGSVQA